MARRPADSSRCVHVRTRPRDATARAVAVENGELAAALSTNTSARVVGEPSVNLHEMGQTKDGGGNGVGSAVSMYKDGAAGTAGNDIACRGGGGLKISLAFVVAMSLGSAVRGSTSSSPSSLSSLSSSSSRGFGV